MSPETLLRKLALSIVGAASVNRMIPTNVSGRGVIICLHSVSNVRQKSFDPQLRLRLQVEFLDRLVEVLRAGGTNIIPLADVPLALRDASHRPFVCFTLDDGYRDNWSLAWPVFRRWKVPFSIFLTTEFVSGSLPMYGGLLERIIGIYPEFILKDGARVRHWPTSSIKEKYRAFGEAAETFRWSDYAALKELTADLRTRYGDTISDEARLDAMDWGAVRDLAADPLVDLGAHTVSHPMLSGLTREAAYREIVESKRLIEREIGREIHHFAYPFGDVRAIGGQGIELVREAGFKIAVTTQRKPVTENDLDRIYALPRITLDGLYQSVLQVRGQISGGPAILKQLMSKS